MLTGLQSLIAQVAQSKSDKLHYKSDEEIQLIFSVNQKFDSVSKIDLSDFEILDGPIVKVNTENVNNQKIYEHSISYKVIPKTSGTFIIIPPLYYFEGKEITSNRIQITVEESVLTPDEKKENYFKKLAVKQSKPEGTIRFTLLEDGGYVEEFRNKNWVFIRLLTKKEIRLLTKK